MRKSRPESGHPTEEELYEFIGEKIRELRGKSRTQDELARAMGVTSNTISRWETAVYKPSPAELDKLARYFGVGIWSFFPASIRPPTPPTQAQHALLSATGDLPAEDLEELQRYADFIRAGKSLKGAKGGKASRGKT